MCDEEVGVFGVKVEFNWTFATQPDVKSTQRTSLRFVQRPERVQLLSPFEIMALLCLMSNLPFWCESPVRQSTSSFKISSTGLLCRCLLLLYFRKPPYKIKCIRFDAWSPVMYNEWNAPLKFRDKRGPRKPSNTITLNVSSVHLYGKRSIDWTHWRLHWLMLRQGSSTYCTQVSWPVRM